MIRRRSEYNRGHIYKTDKMTLTLDGTHTTDLTWNYRTVSMITGKELKYITETIPAGVTEYVYEFPKYCTNKTIQLRGLSSALVSAKIEGDLLFSYPYDGTFQTCNKLTDVIISGAVVVLQTNGMFYGCSSLQSLDVSNWDTSACKNMLSMFYGCSSLQSLDVSNWDTSACTNMVQMFSGCSSLTTLDVSSWNTENVTSMYSMFIGCSSLTTLDVSSWNTENVTSMYSMFYGCSSLTTLDVSSWNTENVTSMYSMFSGCSSLTTLDLSNWDTSACKNMFRMFSGINKIKRLDLSSFNTENVTYLCGQLYWYTFIGGNELEEVVFGKFDLSKHNVKNMTGFFVHTCPKLTTVRCAPDGYFRNVKGNFAFHTIPNISKESMMLFINGLYDWAHDAEAPTTTRTLDLTPYQIALLNDDEKAIITSKGWTL